MWVYKRHICQLYCIIIKAEKKLKRNVGKIGCWKQLGFKRKKITLEDNKKRPKFVEIKNLDILEEL